MSHVIAYFRQKLEIYEHLTKLEPTRDRTWNLLIRSQAPYPFGHRSLLLEEVLLKVSTAVAI